MSDDVARVLAQHRGLWLVEGGRLVVARGRLDITPVTGDYVRLDSGGAIAEVLQRAGTVTRKAAGRATEAQVLAANVDVALVVEPLPAPNARRAERLAALAGAGGVPAALVATKADLGGGDAGVVAARLARRLGLADAVAVSAATGEGIGVLHALLAPGATAVLLGSSGAGKSTLVNALLGERRQATGAIRASDGRGRHTTVTRELIALPGGAFLIDIPGVREAGMWDGATFPEIEELAAACRFGDCAHATEPGCAVRDAVDPERLAAWHMLRREQLERSRALELRRRR